MQVPARRPSQQLDQRPLGHVGDLLDRAQSGVVEPLGGGRADSPQPLDGQRVQELELLIRGHDQQAVRLAHGARHLCEELRAGHPDRDRQAHLLADPPAQARRDLLRRAGEVLHAADVEEGLVDGERLDRRRGVLEDPEHRLARLGIRLEAAGDDGRVRAQEASAPRAHAAVDAAGFGLIARGQHDARAYDHRPAAERRVVALLHRRVEGVEVGVEDARR
jgi:hypothetical protein